jgi:rRNA biogenesis protein RRP5
VKAVIVKLDKRRISLSMKPSRFAGEDFIHDSDNMDPSEDSKLQQGTDDEYVDDALSVSSNTEEDDVVETSIASQRPFQRPFQPVKLTQGTILEPSGPALALSEGFQWSAEPAISEQPQDSDNESSDEESSTRKKKRRKREIEQDLTADMHTRLPESNADFERLLLGSPNSSYLWIQYMSFQLQLSDVEKAREIAQRALGRIHFREEQEKQNIWVALLNLECTYGTDESLESTFKEAARANDSKTIHLQLASIFEQAEKFQVSILSQVTYPISPMLTV